MKTIELPFPGDYINLADYMKAVKPLLNEWQYLHRDSIFKSPVDAWRDFHENN